MGLEIKKRNLGFDCLRLVCAFCVVCIHVPYSFKYLVEPWTRFAVPVFFMLSGFFSEGQSNPRRQIRRILILCIGANVLHLLFQLVLNAATGQSSALLLQDLRNPLLWIAFLLLNTSPISTPLWYLGALLYVLVLINLLDRGPGRKHLYPFIPVLLALNLILGTYATLIFGKILPVSFSRNFLFMGLPFFLLGDLLAHRKTIPGKHMLILVLAAGILLSFVENYLLYKGFSLLYRDLYLGSILMSYALFRLVQIHPDPTYTPQLRTLALWGRKYSLPIYILHPMVLLSCRVLCTHSPLMNRVYPTAAPLIVFPISLALSVFLSKIPGKNG